MLSITSDYRAGTGDPEPYLRKIAAAGFTHIHWCHQWDTDFLYSRWEIDQIDAWFKQYDLKLLNLHASAGREKNWNSPLEYARQAGLELVINRLEMTARLGSSVMILHFEHAPQDAAALPAYWERLLRSLDTLEPVARRLGVQIALENFGDDTYDEMRRLYANYSPEFLGHCYDCGHGNLGERRGLDHLETVKERLIALHLHDNDASGDQHRVPFTANVDWPRLIDIIARSAYQEMINLEVVCEYPDFENEAAFLQGAYQAGERLTAMLAKARAH